MPFDHVVCVFHKKAYHMVGTISVHNKTLLTLNAYISCFDNLMDGKQQNMIKPWNENNQVLDYYMTLIAYNMHYVVCIGTPHGHATLSHDHVECLFDHAVCLFHKKAYHMVWIP